MARRKPSWCVACAAVSLTLLTRAEYHSADPDETRRQMPSPITVSVNHNPYIPSKNEPGILNGNVYLHVVMQPSTQKDYNDYVEFAPRFEASIPEWLRVKKQAHITAFVMPSIPGRNFNEYLDPEDPHRDTWGFEGNLYGSNSSIAVRARTAHSDHGLVLD